MLVRFFLVDGTPEGIRTAELSNSTILCTLVPRHAVKKFAERDAAGRAGVYFLFGIEDGQTAVDKLYIGEGEPVIERIKSHAINKDFWSLAAVFTSKDGYLTKTQIKALEFETHQLAKNAGRVELDNTVVPQRPALSEADTFEVYDFLERMRLILRALGYPVLESFGTSAAKHGQTNTPFEFTVKGAIAHMVITEDGYTVLAGSTAVKADRRSSQETYQNMRQRLITAGILEDVGDLYKFSQDTPFGSPTAAAAVIAGGNMNGKTCWSLNGRSLKEIENATLQQIG